MRRAFLTMASLLGAFLVSGEGSADHAPYHPNWSVGEQWTVDISSGMSVVPVNEIQFEIPAPMTAARNRAL